MLQRKCKDVGVNMEDVSENVYSHIEKERDFLILLIVVINKLTWIVLDMG